MTWKEITKLEELDVCPYCREEDLVHFISPTNLRSMKYCQCGCKIYETKCKLWYVIPSKITTKQVEMEGYYEQQHSN